MKYVPSLILACCAVLFIGCPATSIYPLFSDKDAVLNPSLVGGWMESNGSYIRFEANKDNSYKVIFLDKNGPSVVYKVTLGKISDRWYLDSYPNEEAEAHLIPAHMITQLWLAADTMRTAELESDWLRDMIKDKKLTISHVEKGSDIILTASTEELQKLLLQYGDEKKAFPNVGEWHRVK